MHAHTQEDVHNAKDYCFKSNRDLWNVREEMCQHELSNSALETMIFNGRDDS